MVWRLVTKIHDDPFDRERAGMPQNGSIRAAGAGSRKTPKSQGGDGQCPLGERPEKAGGAQYDASREQGFGVGAFEAAVGWLAARGERRRYATRALMGLAVLAALLGALPAAALSNNVPPTAEPSRQDQRFEAPKEAKSILEPIIPENFERLTAVEIDAIQFDRTELTGVSITGISPDRAARLSSEYQSNLGKPLQLSQLQAIVTRITERLARDGDQGGTVTVPPQTIRNGIVRIHVVPGYVRIGVSADQGGATE